MGTFSGGSLCTLLNRDSVTFRVESPADLLQLAIPLHLERQGFRSGLIEKASTELLLLPTHLVLNGGGLHEEGVLSANGEHAVHARLVRVHHDVVAVSAHNAAHLGEGLIIRLLRSVHSLSIIFCFLCRI